MKKQSIKYHSLVCTSKSSYSKEHDAEYCKRCNIWLEGQCKDPGCEYCADRPEKPNEQQRK